MPSTYAHFRMGQEVRKLVGEKERKIIDQNFQLYLIGLHGPDILFYYHPLRVNSINQIGYGMHERRGKEFFSHAAQVILKKNEQAAYLAYVYGYICHFALDVSCHGYIDEKIAQSGVSHGEIEVELDRELMVEDGIDPIRHSLTDHIIPCEENARVIQAFYPQVSEKQIEKALEGMISCNRLLLAPSKMKRFFIRLILKCSGNYKEMHGLMVNYEKNPACEDSTRMLLKLYQDGKRLALQLIEEYESYLNGSQELNEKYEYTFGAKLPEKNN